ncbi:MAG: hypothetical protein ACX939_10205 [Hyphococcus sp.]
MPRGFEPGTAIEGEPGLDFQIGGPSPAAGGMVFSPGGGAAQQQQTSANQRGGSSSNAAASVIAQRRAILAANRPHVEGLNGAGSIEIISSSDPAAVIKVRFDTSEYFDLPVGNFLRPGAPFSRCEFLSDRATTIVAQFGAALST